MSKTSGAVGKASAALALLALCAVLCAGCRTERTEAPERRAQGRAERTVTIFLAAGLHQTFDELARELERREPGLKINIEASGSLEAARKLTDYQRTGDIVVLADKRLMEAMLIPQYAAWAIEFCTNELVLAYSENSRYAAEINEENWTDVLLREDVRICRADEHLAPIGYRTLMAWQLADKLYADKLGGRSIYQTLIRRVGKELIRPDVEEVIPLIGTEADYAIIYRSTAHEHNLPYVNLPPEINLGEPAQAEFYAQAKVLVRQQGGELNELRGSPIVFTLTIPKEAKNPADAAEFVALLLSEEGRRALSDHGFSPIVPARCAQRAALPEKLQPLLEEGER